MACCCLLLYLVAPPLLFLVGLKLLIKLTTRRCHSKTCLVGKTVIITGANTGIGYETALDMAMRGAKVILACRDKYKAENAKNKIINETGNENVIVKILDLASFKSVREFARDINKNEERLDILIHNAGLHGLDDKKTEDGNLCVMQANYLSHFLLTHLLIDLMKKTGPSRVILVSAGAARFTKKFDINNLNSFPGNYWLYMNTKLCQILFTRELAARLKGTQVTAYSLHPGVIQTELTRNVSSLIKFATAIFRPFYLISQDEGAQTTIYTAVEKGIENFNGEHFHNCKRVAPYSNIVPGDEKKLWEKSIDLIKMQPDEIRM